ncbi:transposase [Bailinhaonella thermotolerans]|uniref:Transposase n=1 Tax=Bailinhaonella thermotolerans TaxID=1070861 RepID=A0A3A4AWD9_9ACTN|nr:transposase [Bailinhaonella thermotolerans]RJL33193.1 transposase [Bailinhaonella thermotolerans]
MRRRWVGEHGFEVEPITLDGHGVLRVRQHGFLVGYCPDVDSLARLLDLSALVEVITLPSRGAPAREPCRS